MFEKPRLTLVYPGVVMLFAVAALVGWVYEIELLRTFLSGTVSMNPVTALLFIFSAIAIAWNFLVQRQSLVSRLLSAIVLLVGGLKVTAYATGFDLHIDQILFAQKLQSEAVGGFRNQIAPNTAANFFLIGISLLIYRSGGKWRLVADFCSLAVAASSLLSVVGYLYSVSELYGVSNYIPMALPTAICFLLLSVALVLNRKKSFVLRTLTDRHGGGRMAKLLLPVAIIFPVVLGLIRLYGQEIGLYTTGFGTALFAVVNVIIFIAFILRGAYSINRSEELLHREISERKQIEARLRESEAAVREFNRELEKRVDERTNEVKRTSRKFRALIENSVDVISMLDEEGRVIFASGSVEKVLGYKADELLQTRAFALIHPEDLKQLTGLFHRVKQHPGVAYSTSVRVVSKSGKVRWVDGTIRNLLNDPNVGAIVTNFHDITERKRTEEARMELEKTLLQEKIDKQVQITQATLIGQEKERKEIGMELHDNINQILAACKLYLDIAQTQPNQQQEMTNRARTGLIQAIQEIRKLSKSMVPPTLGAKGIIDSVREFAELIQESAGLQIEVAIPEQVMSSLDRNEQLAVYRIIQEQLNNIVKHAHARKAVISLNKLGQTAVLQIRDDGKGFDVSSKRSGIGLSNIQSRVEMLKGSFEISSSPGSGCELEIKLPTSSR